ncbi:MAG TPA: hypothetical protein VGE59_00700 [Patescibacteria group bacterium]
MKEEILLTEYEILRREVIERVGALHRLIALASILAFLSLLGTTFLFSFHATQTQLWTYLLFLPPVFAGITFNYQANQMTLEAVAMFSDKIRKQLGGNAMGWDGFYGRWKKAVQLTSFLKTLPLLMPLAIPFYALSQEQLLKSEPQLVWLTIFDIVLATLVVINFYYKLLRKVAA